jgi:hypothetical protein
MKEVINLRIAYVLLLAVFILPHRASAQQFILDSGTPTGTAFPILSNSQWFAGEFAATAGQTVTQLSAYLTSMTGNGDNFAFDIYEDDGGAFLNTRNSSLSQLLEFTDPGTYAAPGWNTTSASWVVPATGDYWLAIEGDTPGTRNLPTFDAQEETSAGTGTVPALAFALDTGTQFKTSGAVPIGLEVTAVAAPLPSGLWMSLALMAALACIRRFRSGLSVH